MNTTTPTKPALNHNDIAKLACHIWQKEGCQSGRDLEYWLQAEWQLQAAAQAGNEPVKKSGGKRRNVAAKGV
jgi:hypothetical protein